MALLACAAEKSSDGQSALAEKQVSIERSNARTEKRVVDEMNLPPHVDGKPRQQKIRHWASHGAMRRYVTVTHPRVLTVDIINLMHWASNTRSLTRVREVLEKHLVLLEDMVMSAKRLAVFEAKKTQNDKYTWSNVAPKPW
ncbi:hypothetical protein GN244_ATG19521 [Phytophthora infestans]|uniref:Uncharacterized protein n=1 Tax=Phytophthora infestans TaxID=4787 RepID=A0A833SEB2_PHYIN|nr:hypothetical protein GN244_ATG19521 [Phytophthora infestans]